MKLLCVPIMRSGPNLTKAIGTGLVRPNNRASLSQRKRTEQASRGAQEPSRPLAVQKYYRELNTDQYICPPGSS